MNMIDSSYLQKATFSSSQLLIWIEKMVVGYMKLLTNKAEKDESSVTLMKRAYCKWYVDVNVIKSWKYNPMMYVFLAYDKRRCASTTMVSKA